MKYKAIIETDEIDDFEFYEDANGKFIRGIDAGAVDNEWILLYFTECEQEDVLDKIRDEIEEVQTYDGIYIDRAYVLEIIDRYRKEE